MRQNAVLCGTIFTRQSRVSATLRKKPFENILGKGEKAGNQQFFSFSHNFYCPIKDKKIIILATFDMSSAYALKMDLT